MKTFNRIFAAATAGLIALTLGLTVADFAGVDLTRDGPAPVEVASVDVSSRIG